MDKKRLPMNHTYIVVDRKTGKAIWEFFDPSIISKINTKRYKVLTAYDYLCALNKRIQDNV